VDQVGHELCLADEVLDEHLLAGVVGADDFDGDTLYEVARAALFRFIDDAHAAFKNLADNVVSEIALDGEESHAAMLRKVAAKSSARVPVETIFWLAKPGVLSDPPLPLGI
jgi:hypothetical protein